MKIIKRNLILKKDTTFNDSIEVMGDIRGYYNLEVDGDINAENIDVRDIDAWDINAKDINAEDINAVDINARNIDSWNINAWIISAKNIDALDIICEKRIKKSKNSKTIARILIQNKSRLERKEW